MKRPEPWAVSNDGKTGLYTVAEIKALWKDRCEIVHENAALAREVDILRHKLAQRRHDEDFCYLTD